MAAPVAPTGSVARRRHARAKEVAAVLHVDSDRDRPRFALDVTADHRHRAVEVLSWKGGKRQARGDALLNANRVALERVNGQPQR